MRVLIVSRYKKQNLAHAAPFVVEQLASLHDSGCETELFLLQGNHFKQWKYLRRKIREFRPDIVHAHYGLSCLLANLATRRVPVVSTYHGSDVNLKKVRRFSKIAIQLSSWNIFVSKRSMVLAGVADGKKASLIPCGVALSEDQLLSREDARKALGWKADEKKVLFSGAFDNAVKDPELAKAAIAMLNGVELVELKGYTRQQVNLLMCAANCLLMTSKTEGSPQVIKEAIACGCPIVSVDVGDVAERTENVEGCFVVNSREPRELADALKKAIAFVGKTHGREKIIEYGLTNEQVAQKIIKIYNEILK